LGGGDTLARLGGDEFAILQTGCATRGVRRLARRLVERIGEPFLIEGQRVVVGASIGIAIAPRDGIQGDELLSAADIALYQAKAQKTRGWRFYESLMNAQAQARRELERDLQHALANEEFELFYQPVLDVATLRVQAFEALIGWRRPQQGLLAADGFIPLCEEMGLIAQLGAWMLRRACRDAANWPAQIGVAVNVSAGQIGAGDLDAVVAAALAESGLAAQRLELEITETALLNDCEATLATLRRLKGLGVRIVMDDFGAGHFSLGYLQSFPFDKIKIDRAVSSEVERSPQGAAILKALLDLCAALNMTTAIDGVETEAQFQALASMGARRAGQSVQPAAPLRLGAVAARAVRRRRVADAGGGIGRRAPPPVFREWAFVDEQSVAEDHALVEPTARRGGQLRLAADDQFRALVVHQRPAPIALLDPSHAAETRHHLAGCTEKMRLPSRSHANCACAPTASSRTRCP